MPVPSQNHPNGTLGASLTLALCLLHHIAALPIDDHEEVRLAQEIRTHNTSGSGLCGKPPMASDILFAYRFLSAATHGIASHSFSGQLSAHYQIYLKLDIRGVRWVEDATKLEMPIDRLIRHLRIIGADPAGIGRYLNRPAMPPA